MNDLLGFDLEGNFRKHSSYCIDGEIENQKEILQMINTNNQGKPYDFDYSMALDFIDIDSTLGYHSEYQPDYRKSTTIYCSF